jgi:hypothetical protein
MDELISIYCFIRNLGGRDDDAPWRAGRAWT